MLVSVVSVAECIYQQSLFIFCKLAPTRGKKVQETALNNLSWPWIELGILAAVSINCLKGVKVVEKSRGKLLGNASIEKNNWMKKKKVIKMVWACQRQQIFSSPVVLVNRNTCGGDDWQAFVLIHMDKSFSLKRTHGRNHRTEMVSLTWKPFLPRKLTSAPSRRSA